MHAIAVRSEPCRTSTTPLTLLQRIESGAGVRAIAAELDVTERTVRNRLRRAGIPLPSERKAAGVDLEAVLADYRAGMPVRTIAERHQVGETWVRRRIAAYGVARDVPLKRKSPAPRYAQLADRRWLLQRMADGASVYAVAKELRTGTRTIYHALRRHGLTWPPPTADPVDRLAYIDDDEIRAQAAQRIIDEATALVERAMVVLAVLRCPRRVTLTTAHRVTVNRMSRGPTLRRRQWPAARTTDRSNS